MCNPQPVPHVHTHTHTHFRVVCSKRYATVFPFPSLPLSPHCTHTRTTRSQPDIHTHTRTPSLSTQQPAPTPPDAGITTDRRGPGGDLLSSLSCPPFINSPCVLPKGQTSPCSAHLVVAALLLARRGQRRPCITCHHTRAHTRSLSRGLCVIVQQQQPQHTPPILPAAQLPAAAAAVGGARPDGGRRSSLAARRPRHTPSAWRHDKGRFSSPPPPFGPRGRKWTSLPPSFLPLHPQLIGKSFSVVNRSSFLLILTRPVHGEDTNTWGFLECLFILLEALQVVFPSYQQPLPLPFEGWNCLKHRHKTHFKCSFMRVLRTIWKLVPAWKTHFSNAPVAQSSSLSIARIMQLNGRA